MHVGRAVSSAARRGHHEHPVAVVGGGQTLGADHDPSQPSLERVARLAKALATGLLRHVVQRLAEVPPQLLGSIGAASASFSRKRTVRR